MSPLPIVNLESSELFDTYEQERGPFRAHMEGRPDLVVMPATTPTGSEPLSHSDIASLRRGAAEMQQRAGRDARAYIADVRSRYGI